jgi:hypothetical protein
MGISWLANPCQIAGPTAGAGNLKTRLTGLYTWRQAKADWASNQLSGKKGAASTEEW